MSDLTPRSIKIKAPIKTKAEEVLEESFYKDLAAQAERLDKFALELIKLQIAIPAIYAGIIKMLAPQDIPSPSILLLVFLPWLLALGVSFLAVFPAQHYQVKANPIIEPIPSRPPQKMAINAYIHFSARRKLRLLAFSSLLSFFGIALAVLSSIL